jgi:hypothetical protein
MQQNDINFIAILNQFWTASKTHDDINFINHICLKMPSIDTTLSNLLYRNARTIEHNKKHISKHTRWNIQVCSIRH